MVALLAIALLPRIAGAAADAPKFTLMTGMDYSTGGYGSATPTRILYVPVIAKLEVGRWVGKLTVPYLEITGPGTVIGGGDGVIVPGQQPNTKVTTASGLGDVIGSASYSLIEGTPGGFFLDITGKIKFPTGNSDKGLSTGKRDYSVLLDAFQSVGRFTLLGTLGYKVAGSPEGLALNNVWFGGIGGAWKFSSSTSGGALFDLRQTSRDRADSPRDLTIYLSHRITANIKLQVYAYKGFSDASADRGGGAMIGYGF